MPVLSLISLALLLLVAGVPQQAASSTTQPKPKPPGPTFTYDLTHTGIDVDEGTTMDCRITQSQEAQKRAVHCKTGHGYYKVITRGDLGLLALSYDINDTPFCIVAVGGGNGGPPAIDSRGFTFLKRDIFRGRKANVFRYNTGMIVQTIYADAEEGGDPNRPLLLTQGGVQDIQFNSWSTNVSCNASAFDLPTACHTPHKVVQAEDLSDLIPPSTKTEGGGAFAPFMAPNLRRLLRKSRSSDEEDDDRADARSAASKGGAQQHHNLLPANVIVPTSVDNRPMLTPVRNQGTCGCCWTFATAALAELARNIARKQRNASAAMLTAASDWLAPQSIIDCTFPNRTDHLQSFGCFGGAPQKAVMHVTDNGIPAEVDYPFDMMTGRRCRFNSSSSSSSTSSSAKKPFSALVVVPKMNATAMVEAVALYGGVLVEINLIPSFMFFDGVGVYDDPKCTPGTDHVVLIVGYGTTTADDGGTPYWIVRNSWGRAWADGGYVKVVRGKNMCGIEQVAFSAVASKDE